MYLYLGTYSLGGLFGRGTGPILMDDVQCTSSEERLIDCVYDSLTSDCHHGEDVGLRCIATCKKLCVSLNCVLLSYTLLDIVA